MGKPSALRARRSRFWKDKTAFDLILDLTERGTWPMAKAVLRSRLFGRQGKPPAAPAESSVASGPRPPRAEPPCADGTVIPRVIFQTWKVRQPLPSNYRYWSDTFPGLNPGYLRILWDDADNREFIAAAFPWFLPVYDSYPREIFRADMVRPFFLYSFGGIYVDLDTECLRPIDETIAEGDVILGTMGPDTSFAHSVPNAIMASKPRQLFWLLAIANAVERAGLCKAPADFIKRPEFFTACILIRDTLAQYQSMSEADVRAYTARRLPDTAPLDQAVAGTIRLLPSRTWFPINWNNLWQQQFRRDLLESRRLLTREQVRSLFPASHMVTYWTHSW